MAYVFNIMLAGVDFGEQGRLGRFHHHHLRFGTHSEVLHEVYDGVALAQGARHGGWQYGS